MAAPLARIGVLGGMGPQATILFMQRVLDATPATDDCAHIPLLVDNNTQVPSRIKALIDGDGIDPGPALAEMAKGLEKGGALALVMPCNTAHNYTGVIRNAVSVPFLSMIELTAKELARRLKPGSSIGILGSPALRITGIFNNALQEVEMTPLYPDDENAMLGAIRVLKASSGALAAPGALDTVLANGRQLIARGADILLVGCTEFSLIKEHVAQLHPALDSLDVLVETTIRFSQQSQNFSNFQGEGE
ncbi:Aspartate racemase [hydrothermal vent metagenome]|uniref:Aspartate racemase n=1 Tax=hydrothermal vent metagenome TaxID=652676 RepID=A0A3B0TNL1_9ZZZZ